MRYPNITKGKFISRPNRFIAEAEIGGEIQRVHVKNTGRCKELLIPGCEIWLTAPESANRKTKYDLVAVRKNTGLLFNIDSQAANAAAREWLEQQGYDRVIPEFTYGSSRIDFCMQKDGRKYLLEIKGCTLETDGIGYFPDAPTERGIKHLRELIKAVRKGYDAALGFVIQTDGVREVRPNTAAHPEFGIALDEARAAGVSVLFFSCHTEPDSLVITGMISG